jgi:hypothetical protein
MKGFYPSFTTFLVLILAMRTFGFVEWIFVIGLYLLYHLVLAPLGTGLGAWLGVALLDLRKKFRRN